MTMHNARITKNPLGVIRVNVHIANEWLGPPNVWPRYHLLGPSTIKNVTTSLSWQMVRVLPQLMAKTSIFWNSFAKFIFHFEMEFRIQKFSEWNSESKCFQKQALCSSTPKILSVVTVIHFICKQKTDEKRFVHVER